MGITLNILGENMIKHVGGGRVKGMLTNPYTGSRVKIDTMIEGDEELLRNLQVAVYVMCGGGMLGSFAMKQPADFYIDARVGRLPYPRKKIYIAIEVLKALAEVLRKNSHNLDTPDLRYFAWFIE